MSFLILSSTQDLAGMNIHDTLLRLYPFKPISRNPEGLQVYSYQDILLTSTEKPIVEASNVEEWFDVDLIVFASKHRSASATPCLAVHAPGNLSNAAEVGGIPRKICISAPLHMKTALIHLQGNAEALGLLDKYEVVMECTHHGDYLEKTPCFFIEIGSQEEEWRDPRAAVAVAKSIIPSIYEVGEGKVGIGLGGPHYHRRFTELMLISDSAVGHIAPKYATPYIDGYMIRQMMERTRPRSELAVIDWKGLGEERRRILSLLEEARIEWIRLSDLLERHRQS
jgi:D-aminoacyl-tRNA deacylase